MRYDTNYEKKMPDLSQELFLKCFGLEVGILTTLVIGHAIDIVQQIGISYQNLSAYRFTKDYFFYYEVCLIIAKKLFCILTDFNQPLF